MSATVKLSSKLPGDPEVNGLDSLHDRLIVDETPVLCLAWIKPTRVVLDLATEARVPTVELARIEPIASIEAVSAEIVELAAELYEERTGRNPLPIGALLAPAGDVDELDEPSQAGEVAEVLLAKQPAPGADVFVYGDEDQGDD